MSLSSPTVAVEAAAAGPAAALSASVLAQAAADVSACFCASTGALCSQPPTTAGAADVADLSRFVLTKVLSIDAENMRLILLGYLLPTPALATVARAAAPAAAASPSPLSPSSSSPLDAILPYLLSTSTNNNDNGNKDKDAEAKTSEQLESLQSSRLQSLHDAWSAATALLTLQKRTFDAGALSDLFPTGALPLAHTFDNDVYAQYVATALPASQNTVKADLVYPASARHVAKATPSPSLMLHETPAVYAAVHRPFAERARDGGALGWVYNILEGRKEAERVIYHDVHPQNGFILSFDTKANPVAMASAVKAGCHTLCNRASDGVPLLPGDTDSTAAANTAASANGEPLAQSLSAYASGAASAAPEWQQELYALAIVTRRDVSSLRDLTAEHLPLLRNLLSAGTRFLSARFGMRPDRIQAYLHYVPSYYHLHVHFSHVSRRSPDLVPGRSHLLSEVIGNIELCADYYQRKTLTMRLPSEHPLAIAIYATAAAAAAEAEAAAKRAAANDNASSSTGNASGNTEAEVEMSDSGAVKSGSGLSPAEAESFVRDVLGDLSPVPTVSTVAAAIASDKVV